MKRLIYIYYLRNSSFLRVRPNPSLITNSIAYHHYHNNHTYIAPSIHVCNIQTTHYIITYDKIINNKYLLYYTHRWQISVSFFGKSADPKIDLNYISRQGQNKMWNRCFQFIFNSHAIGPNKSVPPKMKASLWLANFFTRKKTWPKIYKTHWTYLRLFVCTCQVLCISKLRVIKVASILKPFSWIAFPAKLNECLVKPQWQFCSFTSFSYQAYTIIEILIVIWFFIVTCFHYHTFGGCISNDNTNNSNNGHGGHAVWVIDCIAKFVSQLSTAISSSIHLTFKFLSTITIAKNRNNLY